MVGYAPEFECLHPPLEMLDYRKARQFSWDEQEATNEAPGIATNGARTLLVAPGRTTRNKKLPGFVFYIRNLKNRFNVCRGSDM